MRARNSYLLALLSGILTLLSVPPFTFGTFLAWIALVPLLVAVYYETRQKSISRLIWIASLGALPLTIWFAWWIPDLLSIFSPFNPIWLQYVIFVAGLLIAVFVVMEFWGEYLESFYRPKSIPSKSLSYLPAGLAIFAVPFLWTGLEFIYLNIPGLMRLTQLFGLMSIAKTQWANPAVLWVASFTGMYGITFLVVLVNCMIAYAVVHYSETKRVFKPALIVICALVAIVSYGLVSTPHGVEGDITVAVIQKPPSGGSTADDYVSLSEKALKYDPQIIVWPALMIDGLDLSKGQSLIQDHKIYLMGLPSEGQQFGYGVMSPDGSVSVDNLGYHFGSIPQYIMAKDIKGLFFPEVYGLDTDLGVIGVVDCIESGSALPTRERVRDGVQLLIVPTGSPNCRVFSWALGTSAIYRAAEHRIFAVEVIGDRDASMIIDPYGRLVEDTAPEPEIVAGKIAFTDERTFYSKYGDIFGLTIVGLFMVLLSYNFYLKRKSPYAFCRECRAQIGKGAKVCPQCGKQQKQRWFEGTDIYKLWRLISKK